MPNWNDPDSIRRYLDTLKKNGETPRQNDERVRAAAGSNARPSTPPILAPLSGRTGGYTGPLYNGQPDQQGQPGRNQQQPGAPLQTPPGQNMMQMAAGMDPSLQVRPGGWRSQPPEQPRPQFGDIQTPPGLPAGGIGLPLGIIAPAAAARQAELDAQDQARRAAMGNPTFNQWRNGQLGPQPQPVAGPPAKEQMGFFPSLPPGDVYDWLGLGDTPAAKYADYLTYKQQTDDKAEQFPGQDALLNILNQWQAPTYMAGTTPFIPYKAQEGEFEGVKKGEVVQMSLAEAFSPIGQIINRTINPFNPNKNLGAFGEEFQNAADQAQQNVAFRRGIATLPPEQKEVAERVWTANAFSNNAPQTYAEIVAIPDKIASTERMMQMAINSGDKANAARYGLQLQQLRKLDDLTVIQQNQNPWAELVYGILLDPIDWITSGASGLLGYGTDAVRAAKAASKFNISEGTAIARLEKAVEMAPDVVAKITDGENIETWLQKVNIFGQSQNTRATMATRDIAKTAMGIFTGITSKSDARRILEDWTETGGQGLIKGLGMLNAPPGVVMDSEGLMRVGAGVLGNTDMTAAYPVLAAAKDKLMALKSLEGAGEFEPGKFLNEFLGVVTETSRQAYGLTKEAEKFGFGDLINSPGRVARAILSDNYLHLNPRNWIRQGTGAAAAGMGDGTLSFRPLTEIYKDVTAKLGDMPLDTRFGSQALVAEGADSQTFLEMLGVPSTNPLVQLYKKGANQWAGHTFVPFTGGRVPLGEGAYYDNIAGTTFLRTFKKFWGDAIQQQIVPELVGIGLDEGTASALARHALDLGVDGDLKGVYDGLRDYIKRATVPNKQAFAIADELLLPEHRRTINQVLNTFTPDRADEARRIINQTLNSAEERMAGIVASAPPSWVPTFTADAVRQEMQGIAANMQDLAVRGGMNRKAAKAEVSTFLNGLAKKELDAWGSLAKDVADADDPQALNFAFDVWGRLYSMNEQVRTATDAINARAIDAIRNGADRATTWGQAYRDTAQAWTEHSAAVAQTMTEARAALLSGGPSIASDFDWSKVLARYFEFDEDANFTTRMIDVGGPRERDGGLLGQVRDANRAYVDQAMTELYSVFKAYPTVESFDIIAAVQRQALSLGGQARIAVRKAADEATRSKDWNKFYAFADTMWRDTNERVVQTIQAAKRAVVWNSITDSLPSKLRWTDDFAGDFMLLGPGERPGVWLAQESNGRVVELVDSTYRTTPATLPSTADVDKLLTNRGQRVAAAQRAAANRYPSGGSGVIVPDNIIADYKRLVQGDIEDAVDDALEQLNPRTTTTTTTTPPSVPTDGAEQPAQPPPVPNPGPDPLVNAEAAASAVSPPTTSVSTLPPEAPVTPVTLSPANRVRQAAAGAGIGTDKSDKWLLNSIKKHLNKGAQPDPNAINLRVPPASLDDLDDLEAQEIARYYAYRAWKKNGLRVEDRPLGPNPSRPIVVENGGPTAGEVTSMYGGLGFVPSRGPDWMVPRWQRGKLWAKPTAGAEFFPEGDAYASLRAGIRTAKGNTGSAPELSDAALRSMEKIADVRKYLLDNLDAILAGSPNTMTPQQRVAALDLLSKRLKPVWDNVIAASRDHGSSMGKFAMMDFANRSKLDAMMGFFFPFHYYMTRSFGTWAQRVAAKPQLLDIWVEANRAIAAENTRTDTVNGIQVERPERLRGTMPNPLKEVIDADWVPDRISNPLAWALPFAMWLPSPYPDDIDSDDRNANLAAGAVNYVTDRMFPWWKVAADKWLDDNYPLAEGRKRVSDNVLSDIFGNLGDWLPLYRVGGYMAQAMGQADMQTGDFKDYGGKFDPYTTGRQMANWVAENTEDKDVAQAAQQIILNKLKGDKEDYLVEPDLLEAARKLYAQAVIANGQDNLIRTAGSFLTGFNTQYYPEGELSRRAGQLEYSNAGYGPDNLGGSQEARKMALENNPGMVVGWNNSALVPGANVTRPPGVNVTIDRAFDERSGLYDQSKAEASAAVDAAIMANPGITNKQMSAVRTDAKAPYQEKIDAATARLDELEAKYPRQEGSGTNNWVNPKGMNPQEYKDSQVAGVLSSSWDLPGKPPEGTPFKESQPWYDKREQYIVEGLGKLGYSKDEALAMMKADQEKNYSQLEKDQRERNRQIAEQADAMWGARTSWVGDAYGAEASGLWSSYFDLPKGSKARDDFRAAHPQMNAYNLAAFQPDGHKFLTDRYGKDAVMLWAMTPAWSEDKAQKELRAQYLNQNPSAWMVDAWVDGRPKPFDPSTQKERNYGGDWAEAEKLFGPDIWDKVLQYRSVSGRDRTAAMKELGLREWADWWYGLLPDDGGRSSGSGYVPRGAYSGGRGGGGGGGGRGRGSGGGAYIPRVDPRGLDFGLQVEEKDIRGWRRIERVGSTPDWVYAGQQLKPTRRTNWR